MGPGDHCEACAGAGLHLQAEPSVDARLTGLVPDEAF